MDSFLAHGVGCDLVHVKSEWCFIHIRHKVQWGPVFIMAINTLEPEVSHNFSPPNEAVKQQERKTSCYLGLESLFHADAN